MSFLAVADTDIGISRNINQDSVLVKHASYSDGEVLMAIVCDGMGGLDKGELASAAVIRAFSGWFDNELPHELVEPDMRIIGGKWEYLLKNMNMSIRKYSKELHISGMGTTFSGILFINDDYVIAHVGDSRIYYIGSNIKQLTEDHTVVAREVALGNLTPEEARTDKRRNKLTQCIGASGPVKPQIITGKTQKGVYLICSDGLRHEISDKEMAQAFKPGAMKDEEKIKSSVRSAIELVKKRGERDNISAALVKVE